MIEVLFPQYLMPLTYICPEHLRQRALKGMVVTAPIRGNTKEGIILDYSQPDVERAYKLREITDVYDDTPLMSEVHLKLLEWIGQYYHARPGLVLKSMIPDLQTVINADAPKRAARSTKPIAAVDRQAASNAGHCLPPLDEIEVTQETLKPVEDAMKKNVFSVHLLHTPSYAYGIKYMLEAVRLTGSAIVLCPEIDGLKAITESLSDAVGGDICLIHSSLPHGRRNNNYRAIVDGSIKFVAGTMSAILAPLKRPSLIVVLEEHSSHYKAERSPRYHARDVAVKRGLLEETTVLLISTCPSVSSYYNALTGRYKLIHPPVTYPRPSIRLIKTRQPVSYRVLKHLRKGTNLVYVNKKGYSTPVCSDCGYFYTCPRCKPIAATVPPHPLVLYNEDNVAGGANRFLFCNRCGYRTSPSVSCPECDGYNFTLIGSGTQRIEELLSQKLNTTAVRIDSDIIKGQQKTAKALAKMADATVVVATSVLLKPLHLHKRFKSITLVNPDVFLTMPHYQAMERLFQDVFSLSEMAREFIFIQTAMPDNPIYEFMKNYNYEGFVIHELKNRKELSYPPFSRMAIVNVICSVKSSLNAIRPVVEPFGYVEFKPSISGYDSGIHVSLRARGKVELNLTISRLQKMINDTGIKDVRLDVDVDPVAFF
ncbi:MAG: primosomal protein N' [Nitrospirae bacterium]|nr:primosomal protein N' [Nitrospirota bacterium]